MTNISTETFPLWPNKPLKEQLKISWTGPALRLPPDSYEVYMIIDNREVKSQ